MIGQSRGAYVFIRTFIFFLRSIAPFSILYWLLRVSILPEILHLPFLLEFVAATEVLFYFLVFLPRNHLFQNPAVHPVVPPRAERRELFRKCLDTVPDIKEFIKLGSREPRNKIRRDNVKEWLCWAFLNKATWNADEDAELDDYLKEIEGLLGEELPPGRGQFMVGGHDLIAHVYLLYHSFHLHRRPLPDFFFEFPIRGLELFSRYQSLARRISYYHRPHTSTTRIPVVLIHGVGIGLHTYMRLMSEFDHASRGTVGFIALEIMEISFRLTHPALRRAELCAEILAILEHHGWSRFVLIGQSFGTIISAQMLHDPAIAPRIDSLILFDPVTFLLHLTEMAYNFTRRKPRSANEWQLYYFASTDLGIAHTLARCTFWSENILWKEELGSRRCTVILGARDIVVAAEEIGRYLTREPGVRAIDDSRSRGSSASWKTRRWTGKGVDVLWFEENDHGEIIDTKAGRQVLINVAMEYSKADGAVAIKDTCN
ncbi:MAG: hypothetical protein LQ351_004275 [Letrouitia transgressa]|nr:MAG: hypothetical protein LQ351_004275 [Letrouitia transgressa]